jgi:DNA-binding NtrC family response regulator
MVQENNQATESFLKRKKILLINYEVVVYDDDIRFFYEDYFGEEYEFLLAEDFEEGLAKIKNQTPDLIISEICLFSTKHRSEEELIKEKS